MGLAVAVKGIGSLGKLSIVIQNFHSKNRKINTSQQNYFLQFSLPVPSHITTLQVDGNIYIYIYCIKHTSPLGTG